MAEPPYFIKAGYRHRRYPEYASDVDNEGVVWQPDVYPEAARLADLLGASCIVDVGCGSGSKLVALHPHFDVIGLDLPGPNLELCRARYPFVEWLEHDVESNHPFPVPDVVLRRSVVVCSDVVEHLRRPEVLLEKLRTTLGVSRSVVLSTPERELTWGADHVGPPPNPCHVREWSIDELAAFLEDQGFRYRSMTLTRSNDSHNQRKTILCRLFDDPAALQAATSLADEGEPT